MLGALQAQSNLNASTWSFAMMKRDIPSLKHGVQPGRCRGTTKSKGKCSVVRSISWEDKDCKFFDTALARCCLCDIILKAASSESAVYWCWEFCKNFVLSATRLGPGATLAQMEGQKVTITVWARPKSLTMLEFWDVLEHSWTEPVRHLLSSDDSRGLLLLL